MSNERQQSRPSFAAPLWAAARQGGKEIDQILPAFPESVRCVEEAGTLGNPTPQQVTAQMGSVYSFDRMLDNYASRGHDGRAMERQQSREMELSHA